MMIGSVTGNANAHYEEETQNVVVVRIMRSE